ncbi:flagellar biosynthesis regulator FlaF [Roseomonas sp. CCTCC AB2023176]|uniref:flagellar biosynthesis regulator FlaF n=1 Tax=Roseomonas sp. CCTCC AB2023176 TaxID=3342640 RepID=UPI0035DE0527
MTPNLRPGARAVGAYGATRAAVPLRESEADVFRRVTGALRRALDDATPGGAADRARALADNRRLWLAVGGLVADPTNALPKPLRASILSVGNTVLREMASDTPDMEFLISVNESIAAGLS